MATVLVVDDERDICELIRVNLGLDGHRVLVAHDGEAALAAVGYSRPDLVILDVMMPGLDGFSVLERIKATGGAAATPVIMLTARTDALDRVRGGIEGAVRYVTKPFSVTALRATVGEILGGDPEPVLRRRAQTAALGELARIEAGRPGAVPSGARPRLTRYEVARTAPAAVEGPSLLDRFRPQLSARQSELLEAIAASPNLRHAADDLGVSRTYLYASLRRIARRLGYPTGPELVRVLRGDDGGPRAERAPALADTLARRCAWPDRSTVTVAVSGGADSLALLALARHVGLGVLAVHVDHGLRPGSAADAGVVAAAAARLGATFEAQAVHVEPGPDLEARARTARYQALPYGVLTGHTADDQAETVLLNLLRGAGLDGLAGMRSAPGRVAGTDPAGPTSPVRPLLALRRQETRALCEALGLTPVEDPTNAALVHRRNAVRHRLLPLLAEIGQRDPVPVLDRQSALLADDAALLEALASAIDPTDAAALRDAPRPLARRAVRRWLRAGSDAEHHPPSAAEVARVLAVAAGDAAACELAGGRRVARRAGRLRLEEPVGRPRVVPVTPVGSTP